MTPLWPRLRSVLLFTLVYAFLLHIVVYAQESSQLADPSSALASVADSTPGVPQIVPDAARQTQEQDARAGAAQFNEALDLLFSIKLPKRRLARYSRPSSVFGSVTYYATELFNLLFVNGPKYESSDSSRTLSPVISSATELLKEAANLGNEDAIFELAEMNFYGLFTHPRNYTAALKYYQALADLEGNSTAQHMIGFIYSTGIGGAVEPDQAKALLYHTFAADSEDADVRALMTTAYRHHAGIGTPRDCEKAVHYYKQVAAIAIDYAKSGPPGGQVMAREAHRLADDDGGVYGEGASVSSSGENAKRSGPAHDQNAAFDDVLEYLDLMSRKGELKAIFSLGRLHYEGSRVLQRNYRVAADKFFDVARRYWDKNGKIRPDTEPGVDKLAAKAAGYLGRMFLRGEGLEQNFHIARVWFKRGIENGDALCQYSMGLIHLHGHGLPADAVKAADYFGAAADQDFTVAQVRLGALLMDQGDLASAIKYFNLAAGHGHIEAFYYLAEIFQLGANGQPRNCGQAATYYKLVAEKAEPIHSNFEEANDAYEDGDMDTAILYNMMGAEQGYEAGQANVAYLLDRALVQTSPIARLSSKVMPNVNLRRSFFSLFSNNDFHTTIGNAALALVYWTRSAKGGNVDSLLKMGDYYLAEIGVPPIPATLELPEDTDDSSSQSQSIHYRNNSTKENHAKAAACYIAASETYQSAQALFNLGWMHENGIGLAQDFHLAKRYYDQAAEPPMKEAKAPVALALIKLRVRSWWNWISGGSVNGIRETDDSLKLQRAKRGFWDWFQEFLQADLEMYDENRRAAAAGGDVGEDNGGYMDEWGNTLNGGHGGDENEDDWDDAFGDLLETLVIVAFAALLAALVWYRQMIAVRQRARDQQERQAQYHQQQAEFIARNQQQQLIGAIEQPSTQASESSATQGEGMAAPDEDDARDMFERGLPGRHFAAGPGGIGH